MSNSVLNTALALNKMDPDSKIFESQATRIIREMIPEIANVKGIIGKPMFISVTTVLLNEFKDVIKKNNARIVKLNTETNTWLKLDKDSYIDKIEVNHRIVTDLETANSNIRYQIKQTEAAIKLAKMDRMEESELYARICYVFKLRVAIKNIFKDRERLNWMIQEIVTNPDELEAYLKKNNINEQEAMVKDLSAVLTDDLNILKGQINLLKDFVKDTNPSVYEEIKTVNELDLTDIEKVISFTKNFNEYYKGIRNTEAFLKVEGITEELAQSITRILSLSMILEPLKKGNVDPSVAMIQTLIDENTKLNAVKIKLSYYSVKHFVYDLFDLDRDAIYEAGYIDKLCTFVLVGVYHILDISQGAAAINLLTKIHI